MKSKKYVPSICCIRLHKGAALARHPIQEISNWQRHQPPLIGCTASPNTSQTTPMDADSSAHPLCNENWASVSCAYSLPSLGYLLVGQREREQIRPMSRNLSTAQLARLTGCTWSHVLRQAAGLGVVPATSLDLHRPCTIPTGCFQESPRTPICSDHTGGVAHLTPVRQLRFYLG